MSGTDYFCWAAGGALLVLTLSGCNDNPQKTAAVETYGRYTATVAPNGELFVVDQAVGFIYQCDDPKSGVKDGCRLLGSVNENYHTDEIDHLFSRK